MPAIRIVGPGRAGSSFAAALRHAGHHVIGPVPRGHDLTLAARGVEALVLAVPDDDITAVAAQVQPSETCVVVHLSGSRGLDVLAPHPRRASMHPLVPLPSADVGAARLLSGVTIACAGDELAGVLAASLGARVVEVAESDRAAYHAAACIAANHVVALLGQVERVASTIGLDVEVFLGLARAAIDDVELLGPRDALTGPASRGDWSTILRHLDALDERERAAYGACVELALELASSSERTPAQVEVVEEVPAATRPAR